MELDKEAYGAIYEKEEDHWWYRGRRVIIDNILSSLEFADEIKILDAGCGTGGNLALLGKYGSVDGCDYSEEAIKYCRLRGYEGVFQASIFELPCESEGYNLVTCLDVIEHLRQDLAAFKEIARVLKKGGYLLVTIPASRRLYSSFDCTSGHLRRYEGYEVRDLIKRSGFELIRLSHYAALMHPLVLHYRRIGCMADNEGKYTQAMDTTHPLTNRLLSVLLSFEGFLLKYINLPWGSSFFVLARKAR